MKDSKPVIKILFSELQHSSGKSSVIDKKWLWQSKIEKAYVSENFALIDGPCTKIIDNSFC